jgi:hypothetical protein
MSCRSKLEVDSVLRSLIVALLALVLSSLRGGAAGRDSKISERPDSGLQISVFVFNSAQVAIRDLMKAEAEATQIFGKVGIKLRWVAGFTARDAIAHPAGEPWNPANLDVRIWTAAKAREPAVTSNALAYRLSVEKGQAVLLSDAIHNLAEIWGIDPADLLGVAMAHEIGHLLLHTSGHSNVGIMEARYLQKDLASAERGGLFFSRKQGNSMRNEVRRRMSIAHERPSAAVRGHRLSMRVYNSRNVSSRTLDYATQAAARVLATGGVDATWQQGSAASAHTVDLTAKVCQKNGSAIPGTI